MTAVTTAKQWLVGLALSLGGLLVAAVSVETAVRLFMPMNLDFYNWQKIKRVSARPGQSFELIPGAHSDFYLGVPVQINSHGLRDVELEAGKPAGTRRILGIGDSIAFGYGVRLEETYLKVIENDLNRNAPAGMRYQVINAGMEGTGLDYYYNFLLSTAPSLQPDLVLVGITLNDIVDYRRRGRVTESREFSDRSLVRRLNTFLLFHSQAYFAGYIRLKSVAYRCGILDFNQEHWYDIDLLQPSSPQQAEVWSSSREVLANIVALARERGYPLVLVLFPMEVQLDEGALEYYRRELRLRVTAEALRGAPQQELQRFGASQGVPVIDLLPAFRAAGGGGGLFLRGRSMSADPVHPSARGHQVAGHAIARALRAEASLGWLWPDREQGSNPDD